MDFIINLNFLYNCIRRWYFILLVHEIKKEGCFIGPLKATLSVIYPENVFFIRFMNKADVLLVCKKRCFIGPLCINTV